MILQHTIETIFFIVTFAQLKMIAEHFNSLSFDS